MFFSSTQGEGMGEAGPSTPLSSDSACAGADSTTWGVGEGKLGGPGSEAKPGSVPDGTAPPYWPGMPAAGAPRGIVFAPVPPGGPWPARRDMSAARALDVSFRPPYSSVAHGCLSV